MTVKVFKMINGEEIISKVESETETTFVLDQPAVIRLQKTDSGVGIGLAPFMPYADGAVVLQASGVACSGNPEPNLENEYRRIFGSGIEIVSAGAMPGGIHLG